MDIIKNDLTFKNLNKINILLGKNGCGKSTALKGIDGEIITDEIHMYCEYISPERGGYLTHDAGVENTIENNPEWLGNQRRRNQAPGFKQQTIARYKDMELQILREIEIERRNEHAYQFKNYLDAINLLLENIEIRRQGKTFAIYNKETNVIVTAENVSSGESELISLAIECIYFQKKKIEHPIKILLLDEPDVHLHPDLQVKLMTFFNLLTSEQEAEFFIIIATHSTALLGALEGSSAVNVCFMSNKQKVLNFKAITSGYKKFLPVFGAHPLSNIYNEAPVLLVEGEDDERLWQQAIRSSVGKIKLFPCVCDDITQINEYEREIKEVINSVYDNAKAFSLRDRDNNPNEDINNDPPIIKLRLRCYSAENLMLSNEVLTFLHSSWDKMKDDIGTWLDDEKNRNHVKFQDMFEFKDSGYNRRDHKIKEIRNLLIGITGTNKAWEVAIGQVIANLHWDEDTDFEADGSIFTYLGEKLIKSLIPR